MKTNKKKILSDCKKSELKEHPLAGPIIYYYVFLSKNP